MKNIRKLVIVFICICSLAIVVLLVKLISGESDGKNPAFSPTLQDDLTTIEGVCSHYNVELLSQEKISTGDYTKQYFVNFSKDTISEDGKSNKNYYDSVINAFFKISNYQNILIFDDEKAIKIEVIGNKYTEKIDKYIINGDENYFINLNAKLELSKVKNIELTQMNIESDILKKLIQNNWNKDSVNFGSKETDLKDYEIYFDEGIQVRIINGKVFNIVFTDKYTDNIVDGFSAKSNASDIKSKYGDSPFSTSEDLFGYRTNDFTIFWSWGQVSIYRNESFDTAEFAKFVTSFLETKDAKTFVSSLKQLWPDYDIITEDERTGKVEIVYTLKGVKFNINMSREHGVILYSNYDGQVTSDISLKQILNKEVDLPKYVYVKKDDLVYLNESSRAYDVYNNKLTTENYQYIYSDTVDKEPDKIYDNTQNDFQNPSKKFFCLKDGWMLRVFSYDDIYPPKEIYKVYGCIWADDTHLIYSISKEGIYVYDAVTRETKTLVSGTEKYKLVSYENGKINYDDKSIDYKVN